MITYFYNGTESHLKQVVEVIGSLGKKTAIQQTAKSYTVVLVTNDENVDAVVIRNKIAERLNPFNENVSVARMVLEDHAETNEINLVLSDGDSDSGQDEPRNFSRFNSRHEAFMAYQRENPKWVYQDGIGVASHVDFSEWCWLPIRKDGIYEKNGKYDKYLNR
jgi:hypothetical protein